MKWWQWGWVAVVAVIGFLMLHVFRKKSGPSVQKEIDALRAANAAEKIAIERGAKAATEAVLMEHTRAVEGLSDEQRIEADMLRDNPVALAAFLVRAAHDNPGRCTDEEGRGCTL